MNSEYKCSAMEKKKTERKSERYFFFAKTRKREIDEYKSLRWI